MARLPFNPDNIANQPMDMTPGATPTPASRVGIGAAAAAPAAAGRGAANSVTVSQLAALVRGALTAGLPAKIRVIGEISNLSSRSHWFFNLKDQGASVRCVCFASNVRRINFKVGDGMEVIATGRIDFYDAQGNVQLYVDKLEPVGVGELELRYRALCDELRKLGYFEDARKKPLPPMPQRIAIITSRSGAALHDVINTARKRWRGCKLMLFDVLVQGAAAAPNIAAAISALSRQGAALGIDAILLTRGGGSMEDLWAFNERIVADAVFRCSLPIVAAIGHETDTTIAELVADLRCSTPTQAAMTLVPDREALTEQVQQLDRRLAVLTTQTLRHAKHRLEAAARHTLFRRPDQLYTPIRQRLDSLAARLSAAVPRQLKDSKQMVAHLCEQLAASLPRAVRQGRTRLDQLIPRLITGLPRTARSKRETLDALARQLAAVSPLNVLQRGYTYTLAADGRVIRSAEAAPPGTELTTVFADGRVKSRVEGSEPGRVAPTAGPVSPVKQRAAPKPKKVDNGPSLF